VAGTGARIATGKGKSMKRHLSLPEVRPTAERVVHLLAPACERIEIAGSIRRRAPTVGDIEIVCAPRMIPEAGKLFGGAMVSAMERHLDQIMARPGAKIGFDNELRRNGPRYKRLEMSDAKLYRVKVDLFCVLPPASWGAILAIRTGPSEFSRALVTRRSLGGAMPDEIEQREGALYGAGGRIDTPEEADFFAALGLPWIRPEERTALALREIVRRL